MPILPTSRVARAVPSLGALPGRARPAWRGALGSASLVALGVLLAVPAAPAVAATWSKPTVLAAKAMAIGTVVTDGGTQLVAYWTGPKMTSLRTVARRAGGPWTKPVVVASLARPGGSSVRFLAAPDGAALLLWSEPGPRGGSSIHSAIWRRGRWSRPVSLGAKTGVSCDVQVQVDAVGRTLAGWCASAGVRLVARTAGGLWGRPQYVRSAAAPSPASEAQASRVSLGLRPDGGALVGFSAGGADEMAERLPGEAVFGPATVLPPLQPSPPAGPVFSGWTLVVGPDGTTYRIVSAGQPDPVAVNPYHYWVGVVRRAPSGDWGPLEQVADALPLGLAADGAGRPLIVWQTRSSAPTSGPPPPPEQIRAQPLADPLGTNVGVVAPPPGADVTSLGENNPFLVGDLPDGRGGRTLTWLYGEADPSQAIGVTALAPDGTWGAPAFLWFPGGRITALRQAADAAGRTVIGWSWYEAHTDQPDHVWVAVRGSNGVWSTPGRLAGVGEVASVAVLPRGRVSVLWTRGPTLSSTAPPVVVEASTTVS